MTANCSRKLLNPFFAEVSDVFEGYMPVTTEDENEESERQ
jgi:hypothetical protein